MTGGARIPGLRGGAPGSAVVLVAASGLAREALEALRAGRRHRVVGLVDDDASLRGQLVADVPVLGGVELVQNHPDVDVVLCAESGATRRALAQRLDLAPERYLTVVHPSVRVPTSCRVGAGSILLAGCVLTAAVSLARHVAVRPNVTLSCDDVVEDYVTLGAGVSLGCRVTVRTGAHLGANVAVDDDLQVGADSTIGLGAAVLSDVPAGAIWAGNPARPLPSNATRTPAGAAS